MNIQLVGTNQIDQVWPAIRHQVEKSIQRGLADDITVADIYASLRGGQWFLFVADDLSASLVLRFQFTTKGEIARIVTFSSERSEDWALWIEKIKKFAKQNGVDRMVFDGRKGWQRVLPVKLIRCTYEMECS